MDEQKEYYKESKLIEFEEKFEKASNHYLGSGLALKEIREHRLYEGQYKDFKDYLLIRWQMTESYASRLITAAEVYVRLRGGHPEVLPKNEAVIRVLAKVTPVEQQVEAWKTFAEAFSGQKINAGKLEKYLLENGYIEPKVPKTPKAPKEDKVETGALDSVPYSVIRGLIELDTKSVLEEFRKLESSDLQSVRNKLMELVNQM